MIKKSVLLLIAAALIASVLTSGCTSNVGTASPSPSPTSTYTSPQGFTIKYASDWGKPEERSNSTVVISLPTNNASENLNVQVINLPSNATLATATENDISTVDRYHGILLNPEENTTFAGLPGQTYMYQATIDGHPLTVLKTWTVKDGKAYVITYKAGYGTGMTTDPNNIFDKYLATAQQMIDSFQIK